MEPSTPQPVSGGQACTQMADQLQLNQLGQNEMARESNLQHQGGTKL
jgi:hypothetical protein